MKELEAKAQMYRRHAQAVKEDMERRGIHTQIIEDVFNNYFREVARIEAKIKLVKEYKKTKPKGQLYELEIPESKDFLQWDKPFSEQASLIQANLIHIGNALGQEIKEDLKEAEKSDFLKGKGQDIYFRIGKLSINKLKDKEMVKEWRQQGDENTAVMRAATLVLSNYNIVGNEYPSDSLGGISGSKGRNFVLFDPKLIEIKKTYYKRADGENNNQDGDVKYSRDDNADNTNAKQDGQKAETEKPAAKVNFSKKARQFLDSKDAIKKLFETAKKMNLTPKDIYTHARLNAGNIGRATAALEQGTFSIDENGNINWNGESLKAIMNDFSKVLNVSAKQANQDINDYLIAVRYLADLSGRTDVGVSREQIEKAMTARAHRALLRLCNAA